MADVHSREQRSRNMAAIRGKNTKPELKVRSALHALGYRFRLHRRDLPGNPDIVLPKHRTAIMLGLRYLLLAAAGYAILRYSEISLTAALVGLFVPAAAVVIEILYQLVVYGST